MKNIDVPFYPSQNNPNYESKVRYENMNLGDEKVLLIVRALEKRESKSLILNNNNLTSKGVRVLLESLRKSKTEKIYLKNNQIDAKVLKFLEKFFQEESQLKYINLSGNNIKGQSGEVVKQVKQLRAKGVSLVI